MIILILDKMLPTDREAVKQIYEEGIARSNATFQQKRPIGKNGTTASSAIAKWRDTIFIGKKK
jgi:L-amino acid N-acyltransferase YncA